MNVYPKTFTATELKNKTSEILSLVEYGGYEVIITRQGKAVVKIVPVKKIKVIKP